MVDGYEDSLFQPPAGLKATAGVVHIVFVFASGRLNLKYTLIVALKMLILLFHENS
jgi:hypothetical protein